MDTLFMGVPHVISCSYTWFLVENQREHYVEHQREKQFIRHYLMILKLTQQILPGSLNARTRKEHALDSLSYLMNSDSSKYFTKQIYFYAINIARTLPYRFVPNDGTMQQLKKTRVPYG
jgi:hypothetical protein